MQFAPSKNSTVQSLSQLLLRHRSNSKHQSCFWSPSQLVCLPPGSSVDLAVALARLRLRVRRGGQVRVRGHDVRHDAIAADSLRRRLRRGRAISPLDDLPFEGGGDVLLQMRRIGKGHGVIDCGEGRSRISSRSRVSKRREEETNSRTDLARYVRRRRKDSGGGADERKRCDGS
ncbi:hypothetical protein ACHAWF_014632 [Thalassiosira exigua]